MTKIKSSSRNLGSLAPKRKQYKNEAAKSLHSFVSDLHEVGGVDKETMRSFDESCLVEVEDLKPKEIKKLRLSCECSQPVFARYLNASPSTVEKWETGATTPTGPALKLLNIVKRHGITILL